MKDKTRLFPIQLKVTWPNTHWVKDFDQHGISNHNMHFVLATYQIQINGLRSHFATISVSSENKIPCIPLRDTKNKTKIRDPPNSEYTTHCSSRWTGETAKYIVQQTDVD